MKYQLVKSYDDLKTKATAWWKDQGISDRDSCIQGYRKSFKYPVIVRFGLERMDDGDIAGICVYPISRDDALEIFELTKNL